MALWVGMALGCPWGGVALRGLLGAMALWVGTVPCLGVVMTLAFSWGTMSLWSWRGFGGLLGAPSLWGCHDLGVLLGNHGPKGGCSPGGLLGAPNPKE